MRDFLSEEARMMKYIEEMARRTARLYGYNEIITPLVESYELLAVKAGEEVRLRMYAFKDLGNRAVALRPEFTPSVARLVATVLKNEPKPLRIFCTGSLYRYDEPQRGRFREFWQSDFELIGSNKPEADAEVLTLTSDLMRAVGLKNCMFKVGHVGVLRGIMSQEDMEEKIQNSAMQLMDKKEYDEALKLLKSAGASERCTETLRRLVKIKGANVSETMKKMRDCVENYEGAVAALENLEGILRLVKESGSKIDVTVEAGFARGLEYYTGIIYEVNVPELDVALGGGGRYDKLIELFGGEPTPAVGVAHGTDRMMMAMQEQKALPTKEKESRVVVIPVKEELTQKALKIARMLRNADVYVEVEVMRRKIAKALEDADKRKINYAVIVGERELKEGSVVVRDLAKREQKTVKMKEIVDAVKRTSA
jgi:histidyl-tRNA synthetase